MCLTKQCIGFQTRFSTYSSVRLIATALIAIILYCSISNLFYGPKPAFNVNFVPLIASSPISNEISCKMRVAITQTPLRASYSLRKSAHLRCRFILLRTKTMQNPILSSFRPGNAHLSNFLLKIAHL